MSFCCLIFIFLSCKITIIDKWKKAYKKEIKIKKVICNIEIGQHKITDFFNHFNYT